MPAKKPLTWKIDKETGCWNLVSHVTPKNHYAHIRIGGKYITVHRYTWIKHYGPIPPKTCVCHRCDNQKCINPAHLFLGTPRDNTQDCVNKKRHAFGERHGCAKLTEKQIKEIRREHVKGLNQTRPGNKKELATKYGVTRRQISYIVNRVEWGYL